MQMEYFFLRDIINIFIKSDISRYYYILRKKFLIETKWYQFQNEIMLSN